MSALGPKLTPVDRVVLDAVPEGKGERRHVIVGRAAARSRTMLATHEAGEILNGLEAVGLVEKKNGWWRRA